MSRGMDFLFALENWIRVKKWIDHGTNENERGSLEIFSHAGPEQKNVRLNFFPAFEKMGIGF